MHICGLWLLIFGIFVDEKNQQAISKFSLQLYAWEFEHNI